MGRKSDFWFDDSLFHLTFTLRIVAGVLFFSKIISHNRNLCSLHTASFWTPVCILKGARARALVLPCRFTTVSDGRTFKRRAENHHAIGCCNIPEQPCPKPYLRELLSKAHRVFYASTSFVNSPFFVRLLQWGYGICLIGSSEFVCHQFPFWAWDSEGFKNHEFSSVLSSPFVYLNYIT